MQAFAGVRILDLTHVLAGPYCTYQFALLGADVIKIEAPNRPDCGRGRGVAAELAAEGLGLNYQVQGGNKRALALDLAHEQGQRIFRDLVATADVVVDNYRPGRLDALGVGGGTLCAAHPRLIHCSISGYGEGGPWSDRGSYDNVIQAVSGIMATTGGTGTPVKTAASMVDYATGMNAAFAISAALHARQANGRGQRIDCAMIDTAFAFQAPEIASDLYEGPRRELTREAGLGTYRTANGLLMVGAFTPQQNTRLWQHFGRSDLAETPDWETLWALSAAIRAALEAMLPTRTSAEWEEAFAEAGVPAGRVRTRTEALADPALRRLALKTGTGATVPSSPFRFTDAPARLERDPPRLGEHTAEILTELGLNDARIAELIREGVVA